MLSLHDEICQNYYDFGKAMRLGVVPLVIDLEGLASFRANTLSRQGQCRVRVYDCKDGNKKVFERTMPPTVYPQTRASQLPNGRKESSAMNSSMYWPNKLLDTSTPTIETPMWLKMLWQLKN